MVTTIRKVTGGDYPFYEFACLSIDAKPTSLVPENSICHEIDTGKHFYFSNGEWKELPPKGGSGGGSGGGGLPADFPAEGSTNANKFLGFDANGDYTAKDAPSGGGAEKFVVTLQQDEQTEEWTAADGVTIADIVAADEANQVVVCKVSPSGGGMPYELPLTTAADFADSYVSIFTGVIMSASGNDSATVYGSFAEGQTNWLVTTTPIPTSSNAPLIVTLTYDSSTSNLVGDKTYKEVYDAFSVGQAVLCKGVVGSTNVSASVIAANETSGEYSLNVCVRGSIVVPEGTATDYLTLHLGN